MLKRPPSNCQQLFVADAGCLDGTLRFDALAGGRIEKVKVGGGQFEVDTLTGFDQQIFADGCGESFAGDFRMYDAAGAQLFYKVHGCGHARTLGADQALFRANADCHVAPAQLQRGFGEEFHRLTAQHDGWRSRLPPAC